MKTIKKLRTILKDVAVHCKTEEEAIKNVGKIIVAKQRDGTVGDVKFSYANGLTKIKDYEGESLPYKYRS